jgi:hypothetical protein
MLHKWVLISLQQPSIEDDEDLSDETENVIDELKENHI